MNPHADRIAVPTNGKGPHHAPASATPQAPGESGDPAGPEAPPSTPPFTPTQLAVGFGILASIVVIVAGRLLRRGRADRRGPFGRG